MCWELRVQCVIPVIMRGDVMALLHLLSSLFYSLVPTPPQITDWEEGRSASDLKINLGTRLFTIILA